MNIRNVDDLLEASEIEAQLLDIYGDRANRDKQREVDELALVETNQDFVKWAFSLFTYPVMRSDRACVPERFTVDVTNEIPLDDPYVLAQAVETAFRKQCHLKWIKYEPLKNMQNKFHLAVAIKEVSLSTGVMWAFNKEKRKNTYKLHIDMVVYEPKWSWRLSKVSRNVWNYWDAVIDYWYACGDRIGPEKLMNVIEHYKNFGNIPAATIMYLYERSHGAFKGNNGKLIKNYFNKFSKSTGVIVPSFPIEMLDLCKEAVPDYIVEKKQKPNLIKHFQKFKKTK